MVWWDNLDSVIKMLYCIAIPATLIFLIQTVLSVAGGFEGGSGLDTTDTSAFDFDGNADASADVHDGGNIDQFLDGGNPADFSIMSLLTLQGIVTFFTVMSWTSIAGISAGGWVLPSVLIGMVFGVIAMYAVARLIRASKKLTANGTLNLMFALGETGVVYVPVSSSAMGKVTLNLQGRHVECTATTFSDQVLATGAAVRVVDVREDILVVEAESPLRI